MVSNKGTIVPTRPVIGTPATTMAGAIPLSEFLRGIEKVRRTFGRGTAVPHVLTYSGWDRYVPRL